MHINELDYHLPEELIAQAPSEKRDHSRLMVVDRQAQTIAHHRFDDVSNFLRAGDCLVLNDTKVRACRLYLSRASSGGRVELFVLNSLGAGEFEALTKSGGKLAPGEELVSEDSKLRVTLVEREPSQGIWRVSATLQGSEATFDDLEAFGRMPLPPYIRRPKGEDPLAALDRERYQTIYAQNLGAVAAPTAGLHFTPDLLEKLAFQGVKQARVTLHVGVGTFRPVSEEQVENHPMHAESYLISQEACETINSAKAQGGRVLAVGSTSTRTLEAISTKGQAIHACEGSTDLMILPGYTFQSVDLMLTNFHLPKSTLMALVMAMAGVELIREAYAKAVEERYRFFSYGDAMLIV